MSNLHNDRYDEIKNLIKKSKFLFENEGQINVAKDLETRIRRDNDYETAVSDEKSDEEQTPKDKVQKYRISGGILALHGKGRGDLDITTDDKIAFQETMDEFVEEVSDLVDFNVLNVYPSNHSSLPSLYLKTKRSERSPTFCWPEEGFLITWSIASCRETVYRLSDFL